MRILITGASGFAGHYLLNYARTQKATLAGISRSRSLPDDVVCFSGDLLAPEVAAQAVCAFTPDVIFHLAAQTPANTPNSSPHNWLTNNPLATYHLFEAVRHFAPQTRIVVVSSSAVYGHIGLNQLPITEEMPLQPATMYGVSKASQELVAQHYVQAYSMDIVRVRSFNLVGSGEPTGMITSILASQVAAIIRGEREHIQIRHLLTKRDYTDIRDAVRAYWLLGEHGVSGQVYNLCTGIATSVSTVLDIIFAHAGLTAPVEETDPHFGANDILEQSGSSARLQAATGWQPEITLNQSLAELLNSFESL